MTAAAQRAPRLLQIRFLLPAALVLAVVSLAVARSPTYDVWAWLVWGREIAHGSLDTSAGPQFKPLPVAVAALATPFGNAAVPIWMVVARTAGLLAVGAAARLAWRLAGTVAALLAALCLVSIHLFSVYLMPYGMSEPMLVAFVFWSIDRHCDGRRSAAFALLVGAALLRPEVWPFLIAYAILLYRRREARLALLVGGVLLVPAAWLLPEWWGSGNPFNAGNGQAVPGDPETKAHPGIAVLTSSFDGLLAWVWIGALVAVAWALWTRDRLILALTAIGVGWLALVALLAEAGLSSGVSRYLIISQAVVCVLAGAGWVKLAALVISRMPSWRRLARLAVPVVVAALAVPSLLTFDGWLRAGATDVRHQEGAYEATALAVKRAGGASVLDRCGRFTWTRSYRETQVAWLVHRPLTDIESLAVPGLTAQQYLGVMVQIVDRPGDPLLPKPFPFYHYSVAGQAVSHGVPTVVLTPC